MSDLSGTAAQKGRMAGKSATAFRTISEVSTDLDVPQHVLRFWETKFPQIKPLKRGGGRRYYRPDDVELLRRIQHFLYKEGYTIKGVQRLLKETKGAIPHDVGPPPDLDEIEAEEILAPAAPQPPRPSAPVIGGLFDAHPDLAPPRPEAGAPGAAADQAGPPRKKMLPADKRRALLEILGELEAVRALLDD